MDWYTKDIHAQTLYEVLSEISEDVEMEYRLSTLCIGAVAFKKRKNMGHIPLEIQEEVCRVCKEFIGMNPKIEECPCDWYSIMHDDRVIGREEVIKTSWDALNEYYKEDL
jgi:hypothetical protein